MKKTLYTLLLLSLVCSFALPVNATVITGDVQELEPGSYALQDEWTTVAEKSIDSDTSYGLNHSFYYLWSFDDLAYASSSDTAMEIVFHSIYNWQAEDDDILNVFIKDGRYSSQDWHGYNCDNQDTDLPDWEGSGYTRIGAWSDSDDEASTNDIVFQVSTIFDEILTSGAEGFTIAIDPDCHYWGEKITANAPVPEPATMLLLGTGIAGFAAVRRRKIK